MRSTLKDFFSIFLEGRVEGEKKKANKSKMLEDSGIKRSTESVGRDFNRF